MSSSRDYEISHSTIQLELNSIMETSTLNGAGCSPTAAKSLNNGGGGTCRCLLAVQPFSTVTFIDLLLGSSQFMSSNQHQPAGVSVSVGSKDDSYTINNRVKCVQLIAGLGSAAEITHQITDWSLDHQSNILHIPLSSSQSSSKQFHIVIWFELLNTNIVSSLSSSKDSIEPPSTPILLLDQHNMLNWFPCVVEDKYPMDWVISIPSHCPVTGRKLVAICAGDLIGRYAHHYISGQILYKYSCKIPLSPKSVVIAIGAFESIKINARSLGYGADLFGVGVDEVPDLLNVTSSNSASSRIKVFYPKEWDKDLVYSTCQYLPQALEFVEQWVGASFPFSSLKLVFSGTSSVPIISGATLIIVNIQLLVSDKDLDHVWFSRFYLCAAIAHQWFGHYIAKQSVDDLWIIIGFSRWIAYQFMKKVYGNNEVKFRLKKDMERLCIVDVKQPPICPVDHPKSHDDLLVGHDLNPFEDSSSVRAELMNIKSALVFYMMEQRFGKGLMQKVASKIMMTHMSGELGSGLGTTLFLKLARKLSGKLEIKEFADQWIYRSGSPILSVRYTFNRKKMVIEVIVKQRSSNEGMVGANPKFTGPITIRVQEPAGTFDTEVRLEEYEKKYDIIYHTKYKRIRRTAKKSRKGDDDDDDDDEEEELKESNNLNSMQQQQGEESAELMAEPDRITFEWIRIDPDSLWVCHKSFEQEDFMWNALLRQDKDIIAHYETVVALGKIPSGPTCATLLNILKDPNYFYRIRMEAAFGLTKFDSEELEYVGLTHLTKYFCENYCMSSDKLMPQRNNFEDLQSYYLKCALIMAIARFRDSKGWSPVSCRKMLIDLLRFNDNTGNKHSDSSWVCLLIDLIGDSFLPRPKNADDLSWCLTDRVHYKAAKEIRKEDIEEFDFPVEEDLFSHRNSEIVKDHFEEEDHNLLDLSVQEVMKALKHDRFAGSRNNGVTISCLELLTKWQLAGLSALNISIFLYYSRHGHFPAIRKIAIEALILLSGLEEEHITRYLAYLCVNDPDPYIRYATSICLMNFIALVCQQISSVSHPESGKMTLKTQVTVLADVWSPIVPERYDFYVFRYLAKIMDLAADLLPSEKSIFKYKLPRLATTGPSVEALPPAPQPMLKPLKLSLKGMQQQISPSKPVTAATDKRMKVLERLMKQKHAFWFLRPVDPVADNCPDYLESIKFPMDLETVKRNLESGKYIDNKDFATDIRLTFSNAMKYNEAALQVHVDAYSLSVQFESEFGGKMDDILPLPLPPQQVPLGPSPKAPGVTKTAPPAINQIDGALKVLNKLMDNKHSAIFKYPVDGEMYPEYLNLVSNPIDLQTIKKRIVTFEYQSFQDFHNDMQLLFTNCFTFNRKNTFGFATGNEFQTFYQKLLKPYVKLLDPITVKRVVPPASINPAAPLAVKVSLASAPDQSAPQAKAPTSFKIRIPGKTGITLRLPPKNIPSTKPQLPNLVIKPLRSGSLSATGPSPTVPTPTSALIPSPSVTIKLSRPSVVSPTVAPLNHAVETAASHIPSSSTILPAAPATFPQGSSSTSSVPMQTAIPAIKFKVKAPRPPSTAPTPAAGVVKPSFKIKLKPPSKK